MKVIDLDTWKRQAHYEHFSKFTDPYFGVVIPFDVSEAYRFAKSNQISFFGKYLHDCMKAINDVDELKLRVENGDIVQYDTINASATIMRTNKTFGCSYIEFDNKLEEFLINLDKEKKRIEHSNELFPERNDLSCVHCSALPWVNFSGHKEPVSGAMESVPKLAFSKIENQQDGKIMMNVSIHVNHALVDGYHVGLFSEKFQHYLNK
ncbi:CatA-like O-acetyltransferase [uncultured Psychroserpens sp.]|uniref:CatA-like O-acetyltransferase n=1 Tax=uncultured Psychroserpens sp. TaxID=255436 RepID=UPI002629F6DD|nr:CatA-like O-acetyltransferase [uncultured Psychroserpens sp.]